MMIIIAGILVSVLIIHAIVGPGYAIPKQISYMVSAAGNATPGSASANFPANTSSPSSGGSLLGGCGYSAVPTRSCGLTPSGPNGR
jgi:hypothetical protein